MPASKRSLLTRGEVIFVIVFAAGTATPLLALTQKLSGWLLVLDLVVSAALGLLIAVVLASVVRFFERGPTGR
jgi:hypothetical protein